MKGNAVRFLRFACALSGIVVAGWFLVAHAAQPKGEGFPTDWTHHHLIFSQPASADQARAIAQDTRYWQQWYRQRALRTLDITHDEESSDWFRVGSLSRKTKGLWSETMGTGATVGAGNFPAKYSFSVTTASCSDYVVFNTGLTGGAGQASVIAFDNLYSGCTGSPSVDWAYNTGGQVLTSPAIWLDGKQVAFVQTDGTVGSLVLLKPAASGGSYNAPAAISSVSNASYRSCVAPCMTTITLDNSSSVGINDTTSSVFPDYRHDVIYVGGASGWLFKFSGVFIGTPAEVTTGGFPVQVNATAGDVLTSPVYDFQSGNVFVADSRGRLYLVSPTGAVTASGVIDHGQGFAVGPIVDSTAGYVYIFSSNDGGTGCAGVPCAGVYAFKASSFPTTVSEGQVGRRSTVAAGNHMYEPAFDSNYWNSGNATGNLYVCGATGAAPTLYQLPVVGGVFGTAIAVATLTPAPNHVACSPVTDIYNPNAASGPAETVFFSVVNNGLPLACSGGGCAMSFVDLQWQKTTNYNVGQNVLVVNGTTLYTAAAIAMGQSGATAPTWPTTAGSTVVDGTVTWISEGATSVANTSWTANHLYALHTRIVVTVGGNLYYQAVTALTGAGRSGAAAPAWNTALDGTTTDNQVTWTNVGIPYAVLASTGGTSGIIIDNIVGSGTPAGTSQIYFSTLGNQVCTTSGSTGGCAIQASQSALK